MNSYVEKLSNKAVLHCAGGHYATREEKIAIRSHDWESQLLSVKSTMFTCKICRLRMFYNSDYNSLDIGGMSFRDATCNNMVVRDVIL